VHGIFHVLFEKLFTKLFKIIHKTTFFSNFMTVRTHREFASAAHLSQFTREFLY